MSGEEPARGGAIADGVREEARDQFMQRGLCRASTSAASKVGSPGKILKQSSNITCYVYYQNHTEYCVGNTKQCGKLGSRKTIWEANEVAQVRGNLNKVEMVKGGQIVGIPERRVNVIFITDWVWYVRDKVESRMLMLLY